MINHMLNQREGERQQKEQQLRKLQLKDSQLQEHQLKDLLMKEWQWKVQQPKTSLIRKWKLIHFQFNFWELKTYSKLQIQTVHCFTTLVKAILVLIHQTEVVRRHIPVKNKNISKKRKLIKKKFNPIKIVHIIKRNDMYTLF